MSTAYIPTGAPAPVAARIIEYGIRGYVCTGSRTVNGVPVAVLAATGPRTVLALYGIIWALWYGVARLFNVRPVSAFVAALIRHRFIVSPIVYVLPDGSTTDGMPAANK